MKDRDYIDQRVNRFPTVDHVFYEKSFLDLTNFCSIIGKQEEQELKEKSDHSISILMKNYVIVRLVSLIEYHLKALIALLIDEWNINPKRVLDSDSISIELNVIQNFKSEQYTKGRIIIAHIDKMNAKLITKILSKINRLDFFGWYAGIVGTTKPEALNAKKEKQKQPKALDEPKKAHYQDMFFNLYKQRNDVIHNLPFDIELSVEELLIYVDFFQNFGPQVVSFTSLNIGIFDKKWSDEMALSRCDELSVTSKEKFLDDFKKVTDRFRKSYSQY